MRVLPLTPEALIARPTGTSSIARPSPLDLHELFMGALQVDGLVAPCRAVVAPGEMGLCPILRTDLIAPMLDLVNQHRASIGVGPVAIDPRLQACAEWKSMNMGGYLYMSHDDPMPVRQWIDRMGAYYPIAQAAVGENIAYGYTTAASALLAWLSDYGHRVNVEGDSWRGAGFAVAETSPASSQPGLMFWTQDFGSAIPTTPQPPSPGGGTMLTDWALNDLPLILADSHVKNWSKPGLSGKPSAGGKDLAEIQAFINNPASAPIVTTPLGKGLLATAKRIASK